MADEQYKELLETVDTSSSVDFDEEPFKESNPLHAPIHYGVPHKEWRPNQKQAILTIRDMQEAKDKRPFFLELPTGSGKSAIPTTIGSSQKVLVLVNSLALLDQYRDKYGFTIVKGMREYPCINKDVVEYWKSKTNTIPTVADCRFDPMKDCTCYDRCPYIEARNKAFAADRMACTYPFAMLSKAVQLRGGTIVMDEGHMAAETIVDLSEIRFTERFRTDFGLPAFPFMGVEQVMTLHYRAKLVNWLSECMNATSTMPGALLLEDETRWRNANAKLRYALIVVADKSIDFFVTAKHDLENERYRLFGKSTVRPVMGIAIKYLSASTIAHRLYKSKIRSIVMSATIGEPAPLARELGMDNFAFESYSHPIPTAQRPIYDINFPRMTWDNLSKTPQLYRLQAIQIAKALRSMPEEWRGLVLTSSYLKADMIRSYLEETDLSFRLYTPPKGKEGLNQRINAFLEDPRKGLVVVDQMQGWGHGLDLYGDLGRFVIVASVPFGNHQDPYEKARKEYGGGANYAWWKSYMHVPQACGRVSRGEVDDNGDWLLNVGILADGSATTGSAMRYYPKWFREAIVPLVVN